MKCEIALFALSELDLKNIAFTEKPIDIIKECVNSEQFINKYVNYCRQFDEKFQIINDRIQSETDKTDLTTIQTKCKEVYNRLSV